MKQTTRFPSQRKRILGDVGEQRGTQHDEDIPRSTHS